MYKRFLIIIAQIIIILCVFISDSSARKAPGMALYNTKGELIILSSYIEKNNVILSFWAGYCKPCINEMPRLQSLAARYGAEKNVKLVLVNIEKEGLAGVAPELKKNGTLSETLLDPYQIAAKRFIPELKIPAVFLISKGGEILFEAVGESEKNIQNLEWAIVKLK